LYLVAAYTLLRHERELTTSTTNRKLLEFRNLRVSKLGGRLAGAMKDTLQLRSQSLKVKCQQQQQRKVFLVAILTLSIWYDTLAHPLIVYVECIV
jgi:hypothetical protein